MSIQNAISELIENAEQYSERDFDVSLNSDYAKLESFEYSEYGGAEYSISLDDCDVEAVELNGSDISDFYIVSAEYLDAVSELAGELEGEQPEVDPTKYVSLDGMRAAIGDLIMIRPADAADADSVPAFVTLSQAISKAQAYDRNLAEYEASESSDAEPSESETDSE